MLDAEPVRDTSETDSSRGSDSPFPDVFIHRSKARVEATLPSGRRVEKGTFAGHFDELVRHFTHDPARKKSARDGSKLPKRKSKPTKRKVRTPACVNRALLDRAAR